MKICLRSLSNAVPSRYVTRQEAFAFLESHFDLSPTARNLYAKIMRDGSVAGRYLALEQLEEAGETNPDRLIERYQKHAVTIGTDALTTCLSPLRHLPVSALVANSCTGYLCPGLSSYLLETSGLPSSTRLFDLQGMGCGSALPNLQLATMLAQQQPETVVLSCAVEICSATIFMGDDPGLIVSNSIFGDGAACAALVATPERTDADRLEWVDYESETQPEHREQLRYRVEDHRLRNVLTRRVPVIGVQAIGQAIDRLLARNQLTRKAIRWWAVHPGGTEVLNQLTRRLDLPPDALKHAYNTFHQYGNMSSPSVLFVLDAILRHEQPQPGDWGLLAAFGAGFSAHAALIRF